MGCCDGRPRAGWRAGALAAGLLVAASTTDCKELYERDWLEARSPNFVVVSSIRQKATVTLVQELEDFRQLVSLFTNAAVLEPRVPTLIFVFPGEIRDIGLVSPVAGFFHARMRANYAAVRVVPRMPLSYTIQHEYTHFLMRNQGRQAYPRWYDEGLAELLGSVNLRNGKFDLGNAPQGRMYALVEQAGAWMPYDRLVDDRQIRDMNSTEIQRFYAQSWALTHYLSWGKPGFNFNDGLQAYLVDRESGTGAVAAFERAFGEDTKKLAKVVRNYLRKDARYSKGALRKPFDAGQVRIRRMARDEVAAALGHYCIMIGRIEEAGGYVDAALAANPSNARALVDRADLHKHADRFAEAEALYPQAIALEPDNDLHHLDFGEYWLDRAEGASDSEMRRQFLSKARQEFVLADQINDHNPETLAMYGSSFLFPGENPARGVETLEYAHELLPSEPTIKLLLAQAYHAVGRTTEARPLLQAVIAWEHEGRATVAESLLEQIEAGDEPAAEPEEPAGDAPSPAG